ncbi:efflux RND transporter periplasmic adaptor subunit [Paenibacillus thalictri]|uniref:Efflux RND transporter periplasmic adaptor subunit n=1 Tax=Paenibacillus thalictri TaxID=2527873 RepID=A0A4Q9DFH6_9BACL|nr:efflux RND transporter periplasmic adaptor subunit [Paenibacillus thalictri]TBL70783.1 efflux RND transporter periplasmic adaptor subunit [Paenibacillus thalictri]
MKSSSKMLQTTALLAMVGLLAAGCGTAGTKPDAAAAAAQNKPVKVAAVAKQSMGSPREQVADVAAVNQVDLIPKAGGQVVEVLKKKGEPVQQGEVIFRIDSKDAIRAKEKSDVALQSAEASLRKSQEDLVNNRVDLQNSVAKAQQQLDTVQRDFNKIRNDYDAGLATKQQVDQQEKLVNNASMDLASAQNKLAALDNTDSLASLQAQVASSQLSVQDAASALDNYNVTAPISGVLADLTVDVGTTVSSAGKAGQIQQTDPVKLKVDLTENAAALVKGKQELVYYPADRPDQKRKAKITFLSNTMNSQTKLFALELEASNTDAALKPGSRVMLQLTTEEEEQSVVVPSLSVVREGNETFVFILNGDHAEKRKITLGRVKDANQEVLEGLKPGEQLIVSGQHQLKDGQKVEVAKS